MSTVEGKGRVAGRRKEPVCQHCGQVLKDHQALMENCPVKNRPSGGPFEKDKFFQERAR